MAELVNKERYVTDMAGKLHTLNMRQAEEFRALLGEPPNVKNVPDSAWDRWAKENRDTAAAGLLLLFLISYDNHRFWGDEKPPEDEDKLAKITERRDKVADRWVERRMGQFEREWRRNSMDMSNLANRDWQMKTRAGGVVPKEDIDELVRKVFGEGRTARIAAYETQVGMVEGSDAGVIHSGRLVTRYWGHSGRRSKGHSNAPFEPCPVCSPLEGTEESSWGGLRPGSCHPNCDCFLVFVDEDDFVIGTNNGNMRPGNSPNKTWKFRRP